MSRIDRAGDWKFIGFNDCTTHFASKKLYKDMKHYGYENWHTKSLYIGSNSARLWDKIEGGVNYDKNRENITNFLDEIIENNKIDFKTVDNIISLGCGNGKSDNVILEKTFMYNSSLCYLPIDINPMMIHIAIENIDTNVPVPFSIVGDFEDEHNHIQEIIIRKTHRDGQKNLLMMIGATFSNLESHESVFLNKVSAWMKPEDYFLIDACLFRNDDLVDLKKIIENRHYKKFLFNSLVRDGIVNINDPIKDVLFDAEELTDPFLLESYTDIENTKVFAVKFKDRILLISKRYDGEKLLDVFNGVFDILKNEIVTNNSGRERMLFLLKKKVN